jgi:hypothetical protein
MLIPVAASPSAAASALLSIVAALALCALVIMLNIRTWRHHRYGLRLRRLLSPANVSAAQHTSAPEVAAPMDLPPPGEAAGLPGAATATSNIGQVAQPERAATAAASTFSPVPAGPGARFVPEDFELLIQRVDHTRRLAVAEQHVAAVLSTLPPDRWFVERYVLVGGYRVPFVVLGECGVFAIFPISVRPQWGDTAYVTKLADYVKRCLSRYPGPVTAGLCGVGQPERPPRFWYRPGEPGGSWTMGSHWLIPWMQHLGHEHGIGTEDIGRFRAAAGPNWSRPVKPGPPGVPDFDANPAQHE